MIQPGLSRISQLLAKTAVPWRAVHVAGTNGKGTVCNYVAAMLDIYNQSELRHAILGKHITWAKFTSPHLIDRWDGIQINGQGIEEQHFKQIEQQMLDRNRRIGIGASEFEILTAAAFEAFSTANVDVGIVEVGMGGTNDATNLLGTSHGLDKDAEKNLDRYRPQPLVTAITAIGLDHQAFLGNTLTEIAAQKAGIIKPSVPVVYDTSNPCEVQTVINNRAAELNAPVFDLHDVPGLPESIDGGSSVLRRPSNQAVRNNTSVALRSAYQVLEQLVGLKELGLDTESVNHRLYSELIRGWSNVSTTTQIPGRLEQTSFAIDGKDIKLLIDGAHNSQSATSLAEAIEHLQPHRPLTWLYGASQGRDVYESLRLLLRPGDSVFAVEFGPVDGMPWVKPVSSDQILAVAENVMDHKPGRLQSCGTDIDSALHSAARNVRAGELLVVTGSLYLIGDVHRILRAKGAERVLR